ncbi:MAG: DUF1549 domain-containing protein [Pirellulaceae bacterium]
MRPDKAEMTDRATERLFDVMLCEALGQSKPPDVSEHVLAILDAERDSIVVSPSIDTSPKSEPSGRAWLPLALSAALLLAVSAYFFEVRRNRNAVADLPDVAQQSDRADETPANVRDEVVEGLRDDISDKVARQEDDAEPKSAGQGRGRFEIALNDVPFGISKERRDNSSTEPVTHPTVKPQARKIERLPSAEIVRQLNGMLEEGWQRMGIQPEPLISEEAFATRLSSVVVGGKRSGTNKEREAASAVAKGDVDRFVRMYVKSDDVSHELSRQWSRYLMGDSAWNRLSDVQRREMSNYFGSAFLGKSPYNLLVRSMLTAEGSAVPEDAAFEPATLWMSGLAGARAVPLTNRFCEVFLDLDASCARCHAHPLESRIAQRDYWGLNAIFQTGVHWRIGPQGGLQIAQQQGRDYSKDAVFYEAEDGRQLVATPYVSFVLPENSTQEIRATNVHELASAIEHSERLARATVNGLWKLVYGNRLVGQASNPLSPPKDKAFQAASQLLADQLIAYDYDLGTAIGWIVSSRPMQLSSAISILDPESVTADNQQLTQADLQRQAFAAFNDRDDDWTFQELIAASVRLGSAGKESLIPPQNLLAQTGQDSSQAKPPEKSKAEQRDAALNRSLSAASTDTSLPAQWMASFQGDNGFEHQVKHLFYMAGSFQPSEKQLEAAVRLRRAAGSDGVALNQLWWAIRLSDASL